jgi:hypothetical protein
MRIWPNGFNYRTIDHDHITKYKGYFGFKSSKFKIISYPNGIQVFYSKDSLFTQEMKDKILSLIFRTLN